jgi:hypothetical protein
VSKAEAVLVGRAGAAAPCGRKIDFPEKSPRRFDLPVVSCYTFLHKAQQKRPAEVIKMKDIRKKRAVATSMRQGKDVMQIK